MWVAPDEFIRTAVLSCAWRFEDHGTRLVSTYKAPAPFSTTGEPEATLTVDASRLGPDAKSLDALLKEEIAGIRELVQLADYEEEDEKTPDRGVASWVQQIAGHDVGFIKYRVAGSDGRTLPNPRTVIQALVIEGERLYTFHLIVVYAGHQDEVRGDQIRMIEAILNAKASKH